jgi:hypothetical protein
MGEDYESETPRRLRYEANSIKDWKSFEEVGVY